MRIARSKVNSPAGRWPYGMMRLVIALALSAGLLAAAAASSRSAHAAATGQVTSVTTKVLGQFDAAALLPSGPLTAVASITRYPAGYTLTHHHGGLKLLYVLSGTMELTDDAGTITHNAG